MVGHSVLAMGGVAVAPNNFCSQVHVPPALLPANGSAQDLLGRVLRSAADEPHAVALFRCDPCSSSRSSSANAGGSVSRCGLTAQAEAIAEAVVEASDQQPIGEGPIGICFCGTTSAAIAAILAARVLGRMYLPLDASASSLERMRLICEAAGCTALICDGGSAAVAAAVSRGDLPVVNVDHARTGTANESARVVERMLRERARASAHSAECILQTKQANGNIMVSADAALYLMYTSGSTGEPKGVVGTEAGALSRCDWQADSFPWAASDVTLARTSIGFVDHVAEILAPLMAGVPIVVLAQATGQSPWREPSVLLSTIRDFNISRLVVVPSLLWELLRLGPLRETAPSLQHLHCSGEPLPAALAENALDGASDSLRLINLYGCTEVAADVTAHVLSRATACATHKGSSLMPVGSALSRCNTLLLVKHGQCWAEPQGDEVGEVFVSGAHVANGYYRDPQATAAAFVWLRPQFEPAPR